jgi:ribosome-binding protein aMBF1 (putative translation factor)
MSPTEMTFGRAIARARKDKGLSQKELAAMIIKEDGIRSRRSAAYCAVSGWAS